MNMAFFFHIIGQIARKLFLRSYTSLLLIYKAMSMPDDREFRKQFQTYDMYICAIFIFVLLNPKDVTTKTLHL